MNLSDNGHHKGRFLDNMLMCSMPLSQHVQSKLCCSLRWLATLVPSRHLEEQVDGHGGRRVTVKQLLLSPYQRNTLREEVISILTTPTLYISAHGCIVPDDRLDPDSSSFWPLIQCLAKRGIYVIEEDEAVVNHTVLSQRDPFKQVTLAHVLLMKSVH